MPLQRITVAHSPDSDDAFMFFGLASGAVDTPGIVVDQVLADIETLNRAAFERQYEVTAVSFHAYAHLVDKYALLPLGGNIIRRDLGPEMIARVSRLLHDSIAYALSHRAEAVDYAIQFGRGLDRQKTDRFVGMYVNDLTLDYGERGRRGLERLMADAYDRGLIPKPVAVEFAA